jgi:hypothetical protein
MPLRWAKVVAAQLIKQCKRHSGACGGETHILQLPRVGPVMFTDDQAEIALLEAHLDVMEGVDLPAFFGPIATGEWRRSDLLVVPRSS